MRKTKEQIIQERLDSALISRYSYKGQSYMICPYCGEVCGQLERGDYLKQTHTCEKCGNIFEVRLNVSVTYDTTPNLVMLKDFLNRRAQETLQKINEQKIKDELAIKNDPKSLGPETSHSSPFKPDYKNEVNKMSKIIHVTKQNVKKLYNDPTGNLYYTNDNEPLIVDGFSLKEVKQAMKNGVDFIFRN